MPEDSGVSANKLSGLTAILFDWSGTLSPGFSHDIDRPLKDLLQDLTGKGCRLGIVSSIGTAALNDLVQTHHLPHFFQAIRGDTIKKDEVLKRLLKDWQIEPQQAAYVSDTADDIRAAHRVGMKTVAVLNGFDTLAELQPAAPDAIRQSVFYLPGIIVGYK